MSYAYPLTCSNAYAQDRDVGCDRVASYRNAIAAASDAGALQLDVVDEGPGLPAGVRSGLGRRFGQSRGIDVRQGAGLGHAIARGIVELHGGRISARYDMAGMRTRADRRPP